MTSENVNQLPFDLDCVRAEAAKIHDSLGRLQFVRDFIASIPEDNFNMRWWGLDGPVARATYAGPDTCPREERLHPCGTVACIGGWAMKLWNDEGDSPASILKLDPVTAKSLFHPRYDGRSWGSYTNADAVKVIDHYLETGRVDWSIIE